MKQLMKRKFTSLATAVTLVLTQTVNALPLQAAVPQISEVNVTNSFTLSIPPDLGTIQNQVAGAGPTLVHIQTAHGNYEAQKKIQSLLHYLKNNYGIKTVFLEGAVSRLDSNRLRFFPQEMDLTMKILDDLTHDALVKGPELFLVEDKDSLGLGIEDLDTYLANGDTFRSVITQREKSEDFVQDMDMQFERLTGPYLNKDLRAFLKRIEDFETRRVPLMDWLTYLKNQAKSHLEMDISDPIYQLDWPVLVRIFKLGELESKIDLNELVKERIAFLKIIRPFLVGAQSIAPGRKGMMNHAPTVFDQIQSFLSSPLSHHQLPDPETGILFEKMVAALPLDFNYEAYPNVRRFMAHLILQSEIKADRAINEINLLTDQISENLAKTPEEKKILGLLKDHRLLKRLFALELTPADYDTILQRNVGAQFIAPLQNQQGVMNHAPTNLQPSHITQRFLELNASKRVKDIQFTHLEEIDSLFDKAIEFYVGAKNRDEIMAGNVLTQMKENHLDKAVVVTGGFHAEPFQNIFSSHGFNYTLIAPKMTTADDGRKAYIEMALSWGTQSLSKYTYEIPTLLAKVLSPTPKVVDKVADRIVSRVGETGNLFRKGNIDVHPVKGGVKGDVIEVKNLFGFNLQIPIKQMGVRVAEQPIFTVDRSREARTEVNDGVGVFSSKSSLPTQTGQRQQPSQELRMNKLLRQSLVALPSLVEKPTSRRQILTQKIKPQQAVSSNETPQKNLTPKPQQKKSLQNPLAYDPKPLGDLSQTLLAPLKAGNRLPDGLIKVNNNIHIQETVNARPEARSTGPEGPPSGLSALDLSETKRSRRSEARSEEVTIVRDVISILQNRESRIYNAADRTQNYLIGRAKYDPEFFLNLEGRLMQGEFEYLFKNNHSNLRPRVVREMNKILGFASPEFATPRMKKIVSSRSEARAENYPDEHLKPFFGLAKDIVEALGEEHPAAQELSYLFAAWQDPEISVEKLQGIIAGSDLEKSRPLLENVASSRGTNPELASKVESLYALFEEIHASRSEARSTPQHNALLRSGLSPEQGSKEPRRRADGSTSSPSVLSKAEGRVERAEVRTLVLNRYPDESIVIGSNQEIKVTVLEITSGNQVKLGIKAPKETSITPKGEEGQEGMRVIYRKKGQVILVGGDVAVTVVRVKGNQVKLGIDAPREIPVVREELLKNKEQNDTESGPRAEVRNTEKIIEEAATDISESQKAVQQLRAWEFGENPGRGLESYDIPGHLVEIGNLLNRIETDLVGLRTEMLETPEALIENKRISEILTQIGQALEKHNELGDLLGDFGSRGETYRAQFMKVAIDAPLDHAQSLLENLPTGPVQSQPLRLEAKTQIEKLTKDLENPNPKVRYEAAAALGEFGPQAKSAIPLLTELLKEQNSFIRKAAIFALGRIGAPVTDFRKAMSTLKKLSMTGKKNDPVRHAALRALRRIEGARFEARTKLIPSENQLEKGWVIANHILVAFHSALISSILSIPLGLHSKAAILLLLFISPETLISVGLWYATFHVAVWWHERGHYWQAVKQLVLRQDLLPKAQQALKEGGAKKFLFELKMFLLAPWGKFGGIQRVGLGYQVEAPFNLTVAAAGPQASGRLAAILLPLAGVSLSLGLFGGLEIALFLGRLALGIGAVSFLDRFIADPGKLRQLREQEKQAREQREKIKTAQQTNWLAQMHDVKDKMKRTKVEQVGLLKAPWEFRNSAMGGRHTEKEYPESNISLQEGMFIPLSIKNYEDAQEMTVALQNRLKQIIDSTEGSRVMGIGLEGGLASYVTPKEGESPELRLWRMMKQAIEDLGYVPGKDVAIALDAAASELETAFREEFNQPDAVGQYLFWRDPAKRVMTREELFGLYKKALEEGIPIISIEDGFSENDQKGWKLLMDEFGDRLFVIGDDLVTTKDEVIERAADSGMINTALIKANQIGTLTETVLAMLVGLGKGLDLVVSHRSKKPNDTMEADIALASSPIGLKSGGGANTERLVVYQAVSKVLNRAKKLPAKIAVNGNGARELEENLKNQVAITDITAFEESTNAGIPTVGVELTAGIPGGERKWSFTGATPLGTSAGTGEAIHLVDSTIYSQELIQRYPEFFTRSEDGTYRFKKSVTLEEVKSKTDEQLRSLWVKARRFEGKGVLNAVKNAERLAGDFLDNHASEMGNLIAMDRRLLTSEIETARRRGQDVSDPVKIAQRKGNLGMNAILSVSLALARFKAWSEGKELSDLLREQMTETMAKVVAEHDHKDWKKLNEDLTFDELVTELQRVAADYKAQGLPLYQVIRKHLPIYDFDSRARAEVRTESEKGISISDLEKILKLAEGSLSRKFSDAEYQAFLDQNPKNLRSRRILAILELRSRDNPEAVKKFIVKRPQEINQMFIGGKMEEADMAREASALNLAPEVIYATSDIMIEEQLPAGYEISSRGLLFSPEEAAAFGKELAEAFHAMVTSKKILYLGNVPQTHLIVLGSLRDARLKIRFLDWSNSFAGESAVESPGNQLRSLMQFAFVVKTFLPKPRLNVLAWKNFETRLLEFQNLSQSGSNLYDLLLRELRGNLTKARESAAVQSWQEFFRVVDETSVAGTFKVEVLPSGRVEMKREGQRSVRLALQADPKVDEEMAVAIANDLFRRQLIEVPALSNDAVLSMLKIFLDEQGVLAKVVSRTTEELQQKLEQRKVTFENQRELIKVLKGKPLPTSARRLATAFHNFLVVQESRRITIKSRILPMMINRKTGDILEIYLEENPDPIKSYVVKAPHAGNEVQRSQMASDLDLGPHVIFSRDENKEKQQDGTWKVVTTPMIIEDLLPEEAQSTKINWAPLIEDSRAQKLLAASMALKIYTMIDPKRGDATVFHKFDRAPSHVYVIDNEFFMIDWAFHHELSSVPQHAIFELSTILGLLASIFKPLGPGFWRKFKKDILSLAHTNGALEEVISASLEELEKEAKKISGRKQLERPLPKNAEVGDFIQRLEAAKPGEILKDQTSTRKAEVYWFPERQAAGKESYKIIRRRQSLPPAQVFYFPQTGDFHELKLTSEEARFVVSLIEAKSPRSEVRSEEEQWKEIEVPKDLAASLQRVGLTPKSIQALVLKGKLDELLLKKEDIQYAVGTANAQALGSILYTGQGKEMKEIADGNAVFLGEDNLIHFVETHPNVAIVILGDEGARDQSFSLPMGTIYRAGYRDKEGKSRKKFDLSSAQTDSVTRANENVIRKVEELRKEIAALKEKGMQVFYQVSDALENTNGLADAEAATKATNSWSVVAVFDQYDRLSDDNFRIGGVSYHAPVSTDVTPFDLPSEALPKIAKTLGIPVEEFINHTALAFLGERKTKKDYEKAEKPHRHQQIIEDAQKLQSQYPGLRIPRFGDGDLIFRVISEAGLPLYFDGKEYRLVTFGRSGAQEATAAKLVAADIKGGQFTHTYVSEKSTASRYGAETAYQYQENEENRFTQLDIPPPQYLGTENREAIAGKGVLAMTAITGAPAEYFGEPLAKALERAVFNPDQEGPGGKVVTNTLVVTPEGDVLVLRTTFVTPQLEDTKNKIREIISTAQKTKETLDELRKLVTTLQSVKSIQIERAVDQESEGPWWLTIGKGENRYRIFFPGTLGLRIFSAEGAGPKEVARISKNGGTGIEKLSSEEKEIFNSLYPQLAKLLLQKVSFKPADTKLENFLHRIREDSVSIQEGIPAEDQEIDIASGRRQVDIGIHTWSGHQTFVDLIKQQLEAGRLKNIEIFGKPVLLDLSTKETFYNTVARINDILLKGQRVEKSDLRYLPHGTIEGAPYYKRIWAHNYETLTVSAPRAEVRAELESAKGPKVQFIYEGRRRGKLYNNAQEFFKRLDEPRLQAAVRPFIERIQPSQEIRFKWEAGFKDTKKAAAETTSQFVADEEGRRMWSQVKISMDPAYGDKESQFIYFLHELIEGAYLTGLLDSVSRSALEKISQEGYSDWQTEARLWKLANELGWPDKIKVEIGIRMFNFADDASRAHYAYRLGRINTMSKGNERALAEVENLPALLQQWGSDVAKFLKDWKSQQAIQQTRALLGNLPLKNPEIFSELINSIQSKAFLKIVDFFIPASSRAAGKESRSEMRAEGDWKNWAFGKPALSAFMFAMGFFVAQGVKIGDENNALPPNPIVPIAGEMDNKKSAGAVSEKKTEQKQGPFSENPVVQIIRKIKPSVVVVSIPRQGKKDLVGSGVILNKSGLIVTNNHVASNEGARVDDVKITLHDGKILPGKVIGRAPGSDLAFVRIETKNPLQPITIRPGPLDVGESVIALGHPFGYTNTATTGIVSALGREMTWPDGTVIGGLIQTNASINPGNSGGPLVDMNGDMIGINTLVRQDGQGIAWVLPIAAVQQSANNLKIDVEFLHRSEVRTVPHSEIPKGEFEYSVFLQPEGQNIAEVYWNPAQKEILTKTSNDPSAYVWSPEGKILTGRRRIEKGDVLLRFDNSGRAQLEEGKIYLEVQKNQLELVTSPARAEVRSEVPKKIRNQKPRMSELLEKYGPAILEENLDPRRAANKYLGDFDKVLNYLEEHHDAKKYFPNYFNGKKTQEKTVSSENTNPTSPTSVVTYWREDANTAEIKIGGDLVVRIQGRRDKFPIVHVFGTDQREAGIVLEDTRIKFAEAVQIELMKAFRPRVSSKLKGIMIQPDDESIESVSITGKTQRQGHTAQFGAQFTTQIVSIKDVKGIAEALATVLDEALNPLRRAMFRNPEEVLKEVAEAEKVSVQREDLKWTFQIGKENLQINSREEFTAKLPEFLLQRGVQEAHVLANGSEPHVIQMKAGDGSVYQLDYYSKANPKKIVRILQDALMFVRPRVRESERITSGRNGVQLLKETSLTDIPAEYVKLLPPSRSKSGTEEPRKFELDSVINLTDYKSEELHSLYHLGRSFFSKLQDQMVRDSLTPRDALAYLKMLDGAMDIQRKQFPDLNVISFGEFSDWNKRIAALSYYVTGHVLSEDDLVKRLEEKKPEDSHSLEKAEVVFGTIEKLVLEKGIFSFQELLEEYLSQIRFVTTLGRHEADLDLLTRALNIMLGNLPRPAAPENPARAEVRAESYQPEDVPRIQKMLEEENQAAEALAAYKDKWNIYVKTQKEEDLAAVNQMEDLINSFLRTAPDETSNLYQGARRVKDEMIKHQLEFEDRAWHVVEKFGKLFRSQDERDKTEAKHIEKLIESFLTGPLPSSDAPQGVANLYQSAPWVRKEIKYVRQGIPVGEFIPDHSLLGRLTASLSKVEKITTVVQEEGVIRLTIPILWNEGEPKELILFEFSRPLSVELQAKAEALKNKGIANPPGAVGIYLRTTGRYGNADSKLPDEIRGEKIDEIALLQELNQILKTTLPKFQAHEKALAESQIFPELEKQISRNQPEPKTEPSKEPQAGTATIERALIVDDEPMLSNLNSIIFRQWNPDMKVVDTAKDGAEALRMIQEAINRGEPYQLVFTDIDMPNVDGIELIRRAKPLHPETLFALTSGGIEGNKKDIDAIQQDILTVIPKPPPSEAVITMLKEAASRLRSEARSTRPEGPHSGLSAFNLSEAERSRRSEARMLTEEMISPFLADLRQKYGKENVQIVMHGEPIPGPDRVDLSLPATTLAAKDDLHQAASQILADASIGANYYSYSVVKEGDRFKITLYHRSEARIRTEDRSQKTEVRGSSLTSDVRHLTSNFLNLGFDSPEMKNSFHTSTDITEHILRLRLVDKWLKDITRGSLEKLSSLLGIRLVYAALAEAPAASAAASFHPTANIYRDRPSQNWIHEFIESSRPKGTTTVTTADLGRGVIGGRQLGNLIAAPEALYNLLDSLRQIGDRVGKEPLVAFVGDETQLKKQIADSLNKKGNNLWGMERTNVRKILKSLERSELIEFVAPDKLKGFIDQNKSKFGVAVLRMEADSFLAVPGAVDFVFGSKMKLNPKDRVVAYPSLVLGMVRAARFARGIENPAEQQNALAIPLRDDIFPGAVLKFNGRSFEFESLMNFLANLFQAERWVAIAA